MSKYRRARFFEIQTLSRYCCYGNDAAGSKPIKKLFNVANLKLNKVSVYQKNNYYFLVD